MKKETATWKGSLDVYNNVRIWLLESGLISAFLRKRREEGLSSDPWGERSETCLGFVQQLIPLHSPCKISWGWKSLFTWESFSSLYIYVAWRVCPYAQYSEYTMARECFQRQKNKYAQCLTAHLQVHYIWLINWHMKNVFTESMSLSFNIGSWASLKCWAQD